MSLGNNFDDTEYERREILREAAVQVVLKGLSESEAISVAEQLHASRKKADESDEVSRDEQGNAVSYDNSSLNHEPIPESQRGFVDSVYQELCEKEGLDPG